MTFLIGASFGVAIAIIVWPGFFADHWTGVWSDVAGWACLFYVLIFFMRSMTAVFVIGIIGNAILYGLLATLFLLCYRGIYWIIGITRNQV